MQIDREVTRIQNINNLNKQWQIKGYVQQKNEKNEKRRKRREEGRKKKAQKTKKLVSTNKKIQMESLKTNATNATMYWGDNESLYRGCVVASHLKII